MRYRNKKVVVLYICYSANLRGTHFRLEISEDVHSGFLHHGKQVAIILQETFQSIIGTILAHVNTTFYFYDKG